jgi:hypothetical protein
MARTLTSLAQFRMSMKSDKGDGKSSHVSIPQKDAIAIVPPKKVRCHRCQYFNGPQLHVPRHSLSSEPLRLTYHLSQTL